MALNAFDIVRDCVRDLAGDTQWVRKALLAGDEWIANVVSYSGATEFAFDCRADGDGLTLAFRDDGIPFDPTLQRDAEPDFDDLDQGGMGIDLIRQTARRMHYERADNRNVLTLRFSLDTGRSAGQ